MRRLWMAIASIWTWLVLAIAMILGLPVVALLRVLTAPFDPGRYVAGRSFRWIGGIIPARLNPLWDFRWSGTPPADPRLPRTVTDRRLIP